MRGVAADLFASLSSKVLSACCVWGRAREAIPDRYESILERGACVYSVPFVLRGRGVVVCVLQPKVWLLSERAPILPIELCA